MQAINTNGSDRIVRPTFSSAPGPRSGTETRIMVVIAFGAAGAFYYGAYLGAAWLYHWLR